MKIRNYSFQSSKRLPENRMTEINGVVVPSMPGSCYHAIICTLAENKDQFCPWDRLIAKAEKYMRQYGGDGSWAKFRNKPMVKNYKQRIKDNTHTLTRCGKDCYGRRLHERGMAIYFFQDGATLFTGGEFKVGKNDKYKVEFSDGRGLQTRYRGTTMTYREYKKFYSSGFIKINGETKDTEGIRELRMRAIASIPTSASEQRRVKVSISLDESYNQETAGRLESLGLLVNGTDETGIIGTVPHDKISLLREDCDVLSVETV